MTIFLSLLLISWSIVSASPVAQDAARITLKVTAKLNAESAKALIQKDHARMDALKSASSNGGNRSLNAVDAGVLFLTEVGIGTPPTDHLVLVDTGSSNLWIGASQKYKVTSTSVNTGNAVEVIYGSGGFFGEEWLDTVTLTSDLVIKQQSLGVASSTVGVNGFDGILGLGPVDLTQGTVNNTFEVPTVMDNLYSQKQISQQVLGIFYAPSYAPHNTGILTFGGHDQSVLRSSVAYVPLVKNTPASSSWGIEESISYGKTTIMTTTDGVVDSGTTFIYIPSEAYQQYQSLTGGTLDNSTGLLTVTSTQYAKLQTLYFNIGGKSYGLSPNGQIWPRALNNAIGGSPNTIYLVVNDQGPSSSQRYNFINGLTFLQRFYAVFDTTNQRMGFAETIYTDSNTN